MYMKRTAVTLFFIALLTIIYTLAVPVVADTSGDTRIEYEEKTVLEGSPTGDYVVNVRAKPDAESAKVAKLAPGKTCTVHSKNNGWYYVEVDGVYGYIRMDLLTVSSRTITVEKVIITEDPLNASIKGFSVPYMIAPGADFTLSGTISSNIPIVEIRFTVYDVRQLKNETAVKVNYAHKQGVYGYDLKAMSNNKAFKNLVSGEKIARVTVRSANDEQLVAEKGFYVSGMCADAVSATSQCDISTSNGNVKAMLDDSYGTSWSPSSSSDFIKIRIPSSVDAGGLYMEFDKAPSKMLIEFYDRKGNIIEKIAEKNPSGLWNLYYELPEGLLGIKVYTYDRSNGVNKLRVYERGKVSPVVQQWAETPDRIDLMLFCAHMNDETLYFSGTLAKLSAEGKNVMVVYMTTDTRRKHAEALDCIWTAGCKVHPIFLNFMDYKVDSYSKAEWLWGKDETIHAIMSVLRKYKPLVVMTHDTEGEYGHNQHKMTSRYTIRCVEACANAKVDPESAKAYGVWEVPKLYVHLYDESKRLELNFNRGMEELHGFSPMQVAFISFDKHQSQIKRYSLKGDGVTYDCTWFSLYRSTVGDDVNKDSFFENLEKYYE